MFCVWVCLCVYVCGWVFGVGWGGGGVGSPDVSAFATSALPSLIGSMRKDNIRVAFIGDQVAVGGARAG